MNNFQHAFYFVNGVHTWCICLWMRGCGAWLLWHSCRPRAKFWRESSSSVAVGRISSVAHCCVCQVSELLESLASASYLPGGAHLPLCLAFYVHSEDLNSCLHSKYFIQWGTSLVPNMNLNLGMLNLQSWRNICILTPGWKSSHFLGDTGHTYSNGGNNSVSV